MSATNHPQHRAGLLRTLCLVVFGAPDVLWLNRGVCVVVSLLPFFTVYSVRSAATHGTMNRGAAAQVLGDLRAD